MDPLTSLVTALAAGAAAALQSTVEQGVKDGYAALKGLIQRKYTHVDVNQLEPNPTSKNRRGVMEEELAAAGADQDAEVLQQAQVLLEAIQHQAPPSGCGDRCGFARHRRRGASDPAGHHYRGGCKSRTSQNER
jgi:hypothetical protein